MNKKSAKDRAKIIRLLCEGNSLRGTARLADCAYMTVLKLLVDVGAACEEYQRQHLVNLPCKHIQIDEIWSFVYAKNKNVQYGMEDYAGDLWTFTALCPETKLVPTWYVGARNAVCAKEFVADLASRMSGCIQLTSDGFAKYKDAVEEAFQDIDYGMIYKMYDEYSGRYLGSQKVTHLGKPDKQLMTTAHVERQNLTMRTNIRRFTRKTNAFSKKTENHCHAVALYFMFYNFCRIHKTLRVTPAMAAGVTDRVWDVEDIARLIE